MKQTSYFAEQVIDGHTLRH